MKFSIITSVVCLLGLSIGGLIAKPAPAQMLLKGRKVAETGYVTKADAGKVYFSASPTGKNERGYPRSTVVRLTFKEPEGWAEAETARRNGNYEEAEKLYATIAVDFRALGALENNYGSLARLSQLECLRNMGAYAKLSKTIPQLKKTGLSPKLHAQADLYVGWAALTDLSTPKRIENLELMIKGYREKELLPNQLAQAFFLSAVAHEKRGDASRALTDYHRAFTLDYGEDRALAKKAMSAALVLYAAEHRLHKDRQRLEEAHALAGLYKQVFQDDVPEEADKFTKPLPPAEDE